MAYLFLDVCSHSLLFAEGIADAALLYRPIAQRGDDSDDGLGYDSVERLSVIRHSRLKR